MERYGIMRGLLLSPPLQGATSLPNDKIITLCTRSDGRLAPVITVEPTAKDVKAALKLAEENKKEVKAFKIRLGYVKASAQSPVFNGLYDYAESERLPVTKHSEALDLVRRLDVEESDKEKILWSNAERVFRL